jgi:hypothetical protein
MFKHALAILLLSALSALSACSTRPPAPTAGTLHIELGALPPSPPTITLTMPDGSSRPVRGSETLRELAPGNYMLAADRVASGSEVWYPSAGTQTAVVTAGTTTTVRLGYTAMPFSLGLQEVARVPGAIYLVAPRGDARQFIVERDGRIHVRQNGAVLGTPFLDINERVLAQGEGGLLSIAFHPDYAANGWFFVYYLDKLHGVVVERWRVSSDPNRAMPEPDLRILRIQKINRTHNGGTIAFGPDGMLYLATGDDGGSGDPFRHAQNLDSLLGKVLRIDVSQSSRDERYRVPPSNPFVGQEGIRPEIWAYGLRNPWRFAFDADYLYLGDVGQDLREEVDVAPAREGGQNYGWPRLEGSACYRPSRCDSSGTTLPAVEYSHPTGCSVIGGFPYGGATMPELAGHYVYSDFCSGFVRSFLYRGGVGAQIDWLVPRPGLVQSFGRDAEGELYLIGLDGRIFKLVRRPPGAASAARAVRAPAG